MRFCTCCAVKADWLSMRALCVRCQKTPRAHCFAASMTGAQGSYGPSKVCRCSSNGRMPGRQSGDASSMLATDSEIAL